MCDKVGPQIVDSGEGFLRQVYPSWLDDEGEPSSQAFYPWREIDDGCLSVDRSKLTTPEQAYVLFTAPRPDGSHAASQGVWGVELSEVHRFGLTAWEDPQVADERQHTNPAHALVEFESVPDKKWKGVGRQLKAIALARGRLFPLPALVPAATAG